MHLTLYPSFGNLTTHIAILYEGPKKSIFYTFITCSHLFIISDLPNSSAANIKKESAQKESELAVKYTKVQDICAYKNCKKPQDENVDWLDCDGCHQWFHNKCVSVNPKMSRKETFKYYCSPCEIKRLKSKRHTESEKSKKSRRAMNKCFKTSPMRSINISTNASDIPVSDKKISLTNPLKKQKSEANEMNTIEKPIQKLPLSLTMPCSISMSQLSLKLQKSLRRTIKENIEKQSETNSKLPSNLRKKSGENKLCVETVTTLSVEEESERKNVPELVTEIFQKSKTSSREQSTELPGDPSRMQLIEPASESSEHETKPLTEQSFLFTTEPGQSSIEQRTENSSPAENVTYTKIGPHWEFTDEKCTLEETFQNVKNVVPISPLKTPDQREIAKGTKIKRNNTEEISKNLSAEPGLSIGQSTESSLEQTTESSTPAMNLNFTKIGPHWEFTDEKCTLEETFQNVKNVVPISPLKTPDQREIGKEKKTKRITTEEISKNQSAKPVAVGPEWPFPAADFTLKRLPSEVMRNYRPLTVGPQWGFSDEEFKLDNSEIFEKIKELRWGPIMESKAYEALRLGHADQTNQKKMLPASSLKTLKQRAVEKNKEFQARATEKEREANKSYLSGVLGFYIPNNLSVKVTEEVRRKGTAKQSPFIKAVQERKRKMADTNCAQLTKMRKIGA